MCTPRMTELLQFERPHWIERGPTPFYALMSTSNLDNGPWLTRTYPGIWDAASMEVRLKTILSPLDPIELS